MIKKCFGILINEFEDGLVMLDILSLSWIM